MKQFYETYAGNEKVSPLVTQLSWTNHLLIMSGSKSDEGTGTFYVDEELAKTKMEKKKIPETVKKEEKDLSIDDMLKLFVKEDDEKKPVKKGISFNIDTDNSKWHS